MDVILNSSKRFAWVGPIAALIITASMILFGYWYFDKTPPIADLRVRYSGADHNRPGIGWLEWNGHHRERACDGKAYLSLIGGVVAELPPQDMSYDGPVNAYDPKVNRPLRWHTHFTIPRDLSGETVTLRTRIHWHCNPLQYHVPFVEELPDSSITLPELPGIEIIK